MSGHDSQTPKPELIIDESEKDRLLQVRTLQQDMYEHPHRYAAALEMMVARELADPSRSDDHRQASRTTPIGPIDESTHKNLSSYFENRTDRFVEYDPGTQEVIDQDDIVTSQMLLLRRLTSKTIRQNGRIIREENPEAVVVRDAIRYRTLALFAGRVSLWQQQSAKGSRKHLPKAI